MVVTGFFEPVESAGKRKKEGGGRGGAVKSRRTGRGLFQNGLEQRGVP